ncbi:Tol-Pal system beta propeller repeat protein TolB [Marinobacter bryozoorum]|nr:Tol-Pal system beta propeller repeat protein TolB [Marinobacter bryozoorum]MCK7544169.1 Tol-Pal system beta propeller repeat protein TolB [Marinobacter bryozoorum]
MRQTRQAPVLWRKLIAIPAVLAMLVAVATSAQAELMIRVTKGAGEAVPVAVVPFGQSGDLPAGDNVSTIIRNNLEMTGEFNPLAADRMLSLPTSVDDVFFRDWRMLGQRYLLVGDVSREGDRVRARYELFDVNGERRLLGESSSTTVSNIRSLAHHISDKVYEALTGEPGVFSTRLAYVTRDEQGGKPRYRLQVSDVDGRRASVRLESREPILSPAWSPDGRKLAYVSFESGKPQIFVHELAAGKRTAVASFPGLNSAPDWSPDGRSLLVTLSRSGNAEVYKLDVESRSLTRLTDHWGIDTEGAWHPDGEGFAFTSDRSGGPQIYIKDSENASPRRVTFGGRYNAGARFSPDGDYIYYVHQREGAFHIARMELETGNEQILTRTGMDESPSIAPNGRMLIYATRQGSDSVLTVISAGGGAAYTLPAARGDVREPAWSPILR